MCLSSSYLYLVNAFLLSGFYCTLGIGKLIKYHNVVSTLFSILLFRFPFFWLFTRVHRLFTFLRSTMIEGFGWIIDVARVEKKKCQVLYVYATGGLAYKSLLHYYFLFLPHA